MKEEVRQKVMERFSISEHAVIAGKRRDDVVCPQRYNRT